MTYEEKLIEWEKKINLFDKSGLSMRKWCKENGEVYSTFRHWKNVIHEKREPKSEKRTWLPIQSLEDKIDSNSIVVKHNEYVVEVTQGFNKELFADVLRVLRTL